MSKNNNVNPGQYKVAGRERQGEDVPVEAHKAAKTQSDRQLREAGRKPAKSPRSRGAK